MRQQIITIGKNTYDCVVDFGYDHRIGVLKNSSDMSKVKWFTNTTEAEFFMPELKGKLNF